ncbi:MAG TPA: tetratricopeptide repeat protein [Prolixibacteraceae bacterium]|nr:tetratricopeptide repeat protein [Prolixibacteraceae bacterium]
MKKYIVLLFLSSVILSAYSQNIEEELLGRYRVTQLPLNPLPEEFKTLSVDVKAENQKIVDFVYSKFFLGGLVKIDNDTLGTADVKLHIEIFPFETYGLDVYSYTIKKKVDGVEKSYTLYGYKGEMKFKYSLTLTDRNDTIYYAKNDSVLKKWDEKGASSRNDALKYSSSQIKRLPGEILTEFCKNTNSYLNDNFGFICMLMAPSCYSIVVPKKCKFDYSDLTSAQDSMKKAFQIIKNNEQNVTDYKVAVAPAIEKWNMALSESDITNRKARINKNITCAIYHNLGMTYFLLKEYDKAVENFNKCIEIKNSFGDAYTYKEKSIHLKERVIANQLLGLSIFRFSAKSNDEDVRGTLYLSDGKTLTGDFLVKFRDGCLEPAGGTGNIISLDGDITQQIEHYYPINKRFKYDIIKTNDIIKFEIDDNEIYDVINFKYGPQSLADALDPGYLIKGAKLRFALRYFMTDKLKVYKSGDDYIIYKEGEKTGISINDINIKKKLAEMVIDCTTVSEKMLNGEYEGIGKFSKEPPIDQIIQFVKDYSTCRN